MNFPFKKIVHGIPRVISILLSIISFAAICIFTSYYLFTNKVIGKEEIALFISLVIALLTALYVMTTIDQTSSMVNQLDEMKLDRKMQQQPLIIPSLESLKVDAPRLFFSPPEDKYSFAIRCNTNIKLENYSSIPVVNVKVKSILYTLKGNERQVESECCEAFDAIGNTIVTANNMLLQVNHPNDMFNTIRSQSTPFLDVVVLYDNPMGAHFLVAKQFALYQKDEDNDCIIKWHSDLISFETKEKESLRQLYRLKQEHRDTDYLFESLKAKYKYEPEEICLNANYVPGHIHATILDDNKYNELSSTFFYGRRIKFNAEIPCIEK